MAAAYKVPLVDEVIGRLLITAPSAILVNLILGENLIPEFLQRDCTPGKLRQALLPRRADTAARRRKIDGFARLDRLMQIGEAPPSDRAAAVVLDCVRNVAQPPSETMASASPTA
jgi:lipid-A-disaccharide synthase